MKIPEDKIVDALLLTIQKASPYDKSLMIRGFIACYRCLHNLFPYATDLPLVRQIEGTFNIMAVRQNNKELLEVSTKLADMFMLGLDEVNGLEWALDVIKHNRT